MGGHASAFLAVCSHFEPFLLHVRLCFLVCFAECGVQSAECGGNDEDATCFECAWCSCLPDVATVFPHSPLPQSTCNKVPMRPHKVNQFTPLGVSV